MTRFTRKSTNHGHDMMMQSLPQSPISLGT